MACRSSEGLCSRETFKHLWASRRGGTCPPRQRRARSEVELQPKLHDARVTGAQDLAKAARLALDVRHAQVDAVEGVEHFGTELDTPMVIDAEIFREREIEVGIARTAHDADAGVAE